LTAETGANIGGLSTAAPIQSSGPAVATHSTAAVPQHTRSRWWIEALAIVWLGWVYDAITNLAPLRLHTALAHAKEILSAEQTLHLDPEHSLDSWLVAHHSLGVALSYYYDNAHFIVTLGLLGYMWWRRADIYRPLRNSLVLANVLAFVVFWRFPVAPPRMLPGFTDVVAASHTVGSWHTGALASQANQLAAMPSLHLAWAAWCTLAIWRITMHRWLRALAVVYPFVTAFAVLATGNHFVFDIFGGLATIALSVWIVRLFEGRLRSFQIAGFRRRSARASADATVYGMSQTCYEVQDQLD
jgi:PAP2 superfamily